MTSYFFFSAKTYHFPRLNTHILLNYLYTLKYVFFSIALCILNFIIITPMKHIVWLKLMDFKIMKLSHFYYVSFFLITCSNVIMNCNNKFLSRSIMYMKICLHVTLSSKLKEWMKNQNAQFKKKLPLGK